MKILRPISFLFLMTIIVLLAACAGQQETLPPPPPVDTTAVEPEPTVSVQVAIENLRATPNGTKVGETTAGTDLVMLERRGNWVQVKDEMKGSAWIWAPSVGFASVDVMDIDNWMGGSTAQTVDSLTAIFGTPGKIEDLGGDVFQYRYFNMKSGQDGTLFGTNSFRSAEVIVDRSSREVLWLGMELPPFTGSAKDLLNEIGLPEVRSTKTNFDHAVYENKFPGLSYLEFVFVEGDFNKVSMFWAMRYPLSAFASSLTTSEKKIVHEGDKLVLSMEVSNSSGDYAFASLGIEVELVEGDRNLGTFMLESVDVRVEPGESQLVYETLPLSDAGIDVNQVAARADIVQAVTVPAGVVSQP